MADMKTAMIAYAMLDPRVSELESDMASITNPMLVKGTVDTVEDLEDIENPEPGWVYLVGLEDDPNKKEYVYTTAGTWDFLGYQQPIDDALSTTSENAVQNKVVTVAINGKAALTIVAANFDTTVTYSAGKIVIKDGVLYRYTSDAASTGAWDSTKWTATTISAELESKLNSTDAASTYLTIAAAAETYLTASDIEGKANSSMIAAPYNSQATYVDGDRFTFEGELYKVDSVNGQYISTGNLITAEVMTTAGGYINGKIPSYSSGAYTPETFLERWDYRTSGYIEVTPGMTMSIDVGGAYSSGNAATCDSFYNADKTRIGVFNNNGSGITSTQTRSYTIPANVKYVRLGLGPANYQPSPVAKLVRADMPKVVKTTVDSELNAKANSADLATVATSGSYNDLSNKPTIPDAVTVTQTGDMYIGAVCVRKCLTQAEYDLLDPPDERCDYKIVPATT